MRIGLDVAQTCVERAGCGWMADALATALVRTSRTDEFILYHHFDRWTNVRTDLGTHIPGPNVSAPFASMQPSEASRIWDAIRSGQVMPGAPDIVHAFSYQAPPLRVPLVFTVHDVAFWTHPEYTTESNRLFCQRGLLEALRHADGFHFVSEFSHAEFERVLGNWLRDSGKPWRVIPLGSRFPSLDHPPSRTGDYWLFLGSLEPRKNLAAALDALELYFGAGGNLPLHIAGGAGWHSEDLKTRIASLEQQGRVRRLGYVRESELPALYSGARALVFPSWYEGFGLPVLEAMSAGCPVICSQSSSLPEVAGDAAFYIDPAQPASIARAMHTLEQDPASRQAHARAGLVRARTLTWERAAAETLALYDEVLSRRNRQTVIPAAAPATG